MRAIYSCAQFRCQPKVGVNGLRGPLSACSLIRRGVDKVGLVLIGLTRRRHCTTYPAYSSRTARPAAARLASLISEYLRDRIKPSASALSAAATAA